MPCRERPQRTLPTEHLTHFIKPQLPKFVFLIPIVINYASYHFGERACLHIRCRHFSLYYTHEQHKPAPITRVKWTPA